MGKRETCLRVCGKMALEHFTVSWCFWWDYVRISNPSACLKHLEVSGCDGLLKIDISAANLMTFDCEGLKETRVIAPYLVRASIHVYPAFEDHHDDIIFGLSSNLPQLRTSLLHCSPMDEVRLFNFGNFANLKNLVVNAATLPNKDFLWPVVLLKAAPFIQKFQLNLYPGDEVEMFVEGHEVNRERMKLLCCPRYHLKEG